MRGIGSMLHELGGGTENSASKYYGKIIKDATFESMGDGRFYLEFEDGVKIKIYDDGQSCCENRYMTCDDDPKALVGQTLIGIEVKDGGTTKGAWETHEVLFLEIQGNKSAIQFATHNEHNGYYGGFGLNITEEPQ